MNSRVLFLAILLAGLASAGAANYVPPRGGFDFPIYTNKASGKQVSGQHSPATSPALSPEEAQGKFTVPPLFEVRLFAAEPMVVNPVAMTWDTRGRLWVVELYEYPLGAPKGAAPRDRIKILEDTDADGRADKVKVFADGLNLATGIILGNGGAYVGQAPHLYFMKDTNGDDVADVKEIAMTGFGLEDRHELLNGFTWGPDGWLYMTHGVFTHSKVKDPNNPNDDGVVMNAALARFHPRTKKFELFADGTSNPWGVDFDRYGNAYVSACVIDHLFHLSPGGLYVRQSGVPGNPYAYQLLPSIVDHKHFRAAYSGVQVYQGDQYPAEYRGTIMMGNIHDSAVHQDTLTRNGSTFKAQFKQDFVRANDGWFRPVSQQVGPDGALWLMDWYDKYPCYQNARADPEGVDREHGRIWRVVYTGNSKGKKVPSRPQVNMDLAKLSTDELIKLLSHNNVWQRRTAQRLLSERRDAKAVAGLEKLLANGTTLEARLAALWTLHSSGQLSETTLESLTGDREPAVRAWVARLTGERKQMNEQVVARLTTLGSDPEPSVRLEVASAVRQFTSGSLTVNTPSSVTLGNSELGRILQAVVETSADGKDVKIPFMIWMAVEPVIASNPQEAFNWFKRHGAETMPLSGQLAYKVMRRVCDLQEAAQIDAAMDFLSGLPADDGLVAFAMNGLVDGQKGKALRPTKPTDAFIQKMLASSRDDVKGYAQRLGTLWGDAAAIQTTLAQIENASLSLDARIKAVQGARQLKSEAARDAMLRVIARPNPEALVIEALRALGELGGDPVGGEIIKLWKQLTPATRRAAADMLASRGRWASSLLSALEGKTISTSDIPATAIRTLTNSKDDYGMRARRALQVFGKVRDADADKIKIIAAKKKMILSAKTPPDLKAGHEAAKRTCFTCHKLHGEGADIGPDLTGVGRSSLDALLANIIDPNQIIGAGYENVEIETKDGRIVAGRLVENTGTRVRILSAGPKEDVVAKSDIASQRVSELSVMPEGLEQMPDADFRNLIAYILNPPQDNKPFSWQDDAAPPAPASAPKKKAEYEQVDWESVAHWNPEWRVVAPEFEGTPKRHSEFAGRKNVLVIHPYDQKKGAALEREIQVPAQGRAELSFAVAAHEQGDWELRVVIDGQVAKRQTVSGKGERWQPVKVDLAPCAGKKIHVRLENCANNWAWEFSYWTDLQVRVAAR
ncbi:MAG: PVC-type heme-binding CxxCH protein [Verrucomicrobiota bacterium]